VGWAAPEILTGADRVTQEADIFAFGMVVVEVSPCNAVDDGGTDCLPNRFRLSQEGTHSAAIILHSLLCRLSIVVDPLVPKRLESWVWWTQYGT